jgi:ferredoxin
MLFSKGDGLVFNTEDNAPEGRGIKPSPRIKKINDCISGNFDKMRSKAPFIGPVIYKMYGWARQTKRFRLLDNCTGCGICVKQCPINAIEPKEKKIAWEKNECVMCFGCIHHCPQFAIRYLWISKKHGQYLYKDNG